MALAGCQSGQASAPNNTTHNKTASAVDTASLVEHKAARPVHGCRRDSRPFVEPNNDASKCFSYDNPRRAASSQDETRQESDGRYRSASHDHHGDSHQSSGSARHHSPVTEQTGEPTEHDPVRLRRARERHASPPPDHQSISALPQHPDHHGDSNQTNGLEQDDARLLGDKGEQGVGSFVATSQAQESGTRIPLPLEAMSNNNGRVLANVRPSASQDPVRRQHSLGRRTRSDTDVGKNQGLAKNGVGEHGRGEVTLPPPKRRKTSTSTPAVGETAPQADPRCASSRLNRAQRPTGHHAMPPRSQRKNPKPPAPKVALTTKQAQRESCDDEVILGVQVWYEVKWDGYSPKHNSWEPLKNFDQCPEILWEFHCREGSATTTQTPCQSQLKVPKLRPAGVTSTTKKAQRGYFNVERILGYRLMYLVRQRGCNSREPPEHFAQCPEMLQDFHKRKGSVKDLISEKILALRPLGMKAAVQQRRMMGC